MNFLNISKSSYKPVKNVNKLVRTLAVAARVVAARAARVAVGTLAVAATTYFMRTAS